MKRSEFFSEEVRSFVEWMSAHLDSDMFRHQYTNRRSRKQWRCDSLYDAFANYEWRHQKIDRLAVPLGNTFASNAFALNALREDLLKSLGPPLDDAHTCTAAIDVMKWGGVRRGNADWLNENQSGLGQRIMDTRDALNAGDTQHPALTTPTLRFNSGMTKVYSLVCENFIIYDSRVAAALGWAVVKFCRATERLAVPPNLDFPWAPPNESTTAHSPKRRDPSEGPFSFPSLNAGPMHAGSNLQASWLLNEILDHPNAKNSKFKLLGQRGDELRALEAALFMLGYDLPQESVAAQTSSARRNRLVPAASQPVKGWTECFTLGPAPVAFRYRITGSGIETANAVENSPIKSFSDATINATLAWLREHFPGTAFPLANSATNVRAGTADKGLGTAYFSVTGRNPPDTSRLAAVLQSLRVMIPLQPGGRQWRLNTDLPGLGAGEASVTIRPLLDKLRRPEDRA